MPRKKEDISVQKIKDFTKKYISLMQDEHEDSGEWAYVMLEPYLMKDCTVTTDFLKQMDKTEFDAIAYCFSEIVYKFQSVKMIEIIETLYLQFYGNDKTTEFYHDNIEGLRNCIKKN